MSKKQRRAQRPKVRNPAARAVRDPNGEHRPKVIPDTKKPKYKYNWRKHIED